jgi:K+-transporting ATPase ATPase B chain
MAARERKMPLFKQALVIEALKQSILKLNPKILFRNPVMFTVEIGTAIAGNVCL